MSEVINNVVEQQEVEQVPEVDYKALYEETQKKLDTVAAHKDKLYQETKAAKAEREAAKAEAMRIEQEKAVKDGEFEKLWQTTKQEKDALLKQLSDVKSATRNEKIQLTSMRVANELADGDNVELLSVFVQTKIAALADEAGQVAPDVAEAIVHEFKNNMKFKALLRGSKAAGGGAPGGSHSVQTNKTITRTEFNALDNNRKREFLKSGSIVD